MPIIHTVRGRTRSGPHIFIAVPCGDGCIHAPCVMSLFEATQVLDAAGFNVTLSLEAGNCHVDDARNSQVREFLRTDATDMVFIDADVGFRPEDLLRLVSVERDVVAGVYPKKEDAESFPVRTLPGEIWADADGLVEVEGVPTGFLRMKRRVLEALCEGAVSFIGQSGDPLPYHVVFERIIDGNKRMSGDYAFCWKWRETGGKIYVDPEMQFSHTGNKTWYGSLGAFWKRCHGVDGAQRANKLAWGVDQLKVGNASPAAFQALCMGWGNEWAAEPALLADVWDRATGRVLECGSGLTTLVLAIKGADSTVLEHDPAFASHTAKMLARFGLEAGIQICPLVDGWYDFAGGEFDTVIVDGPPRALGKRDTVYARVKAPLWIVDDVGGSPRHIIKEMEAV